MSKNNEKKYFQQTIRQSELKSRVQATKDRKHSYINRQIYKTLIIIHISFNQTSTNKNPFKRMSATNYKDATSKTDLEDILQQCSICYRSTNDGNFILCHSDLPSILLKNYKKLPTYNFIVNSLNESDNTSELVKIGHWINIVVLKQAGRFYHALLCDSLDGITSNLEVMHNIRKFCFNNSLRLHCLNGRYQKDTSSLCGYLTSGIIAYTHGKRRLSDIARLQKLFLRNSVKTNENLVLKMYKKHFT